MGDASQVKLAIVEESVFGTNPGSGFNYLRYTAETLQGQQQNVASGEIDPERNPPGTQRVNYNASGDISYEMSLVPYAASPGDGFDMLIEGAMQNDWSTEIGLLLKDIDIKNFSGGTFDLEDTLASGAFANVVVGQWIKLGAYATNGTIYAHVLTKTDSDNIGCEGVRSDGTAVADEAAGGAIISVDGSYIRIGTTKKSYSIEKQFADLSTPEYELYTGMRVGTWSLGLNPQAIFGGSFGFLGKDKDTTTSSGTGGGETPKWTSTVLQAVDHFKMKMVDAFTAKTSERISAISFDYNNGLRAEPELGVRGSESIGISTVSLTGTLNLYVADLDLMRSYEDSVLSKVAYRLDDGTSQMIITLPAIRLTDGTALATGNDQSVLAQFQWAAEPDANNIAFQVDRF